MYFWNLILYIFVHFYIPFFVHSYFIINNNEVDKIKSEYEEKAFDLERKYKSKIKSLEKENSHLNKIIDKFYEVIEKFIDWICQKFGIGESKELVRNFEKETNTFIDPEKQIKKEEREKEWELER